MELKKKREKKNELLRVDIYYHSILNNKTMQRNRKTQQVHANKPGVADVLLQNLDAQIMEVTETRRAGQKLQGSNHLKAETTQQQAKIKHA